MTVRKLSELSRKPVTLNHMFKCNKVDVFKPPCYVYRNYIIQKYVNFPCIIKLIKDK